MRSGEVCPAASSSSPLCDDEVLWVGVRDSHSIESFPPISSSPDYYKFHAETATTPYTRRTLTALSTRSVAKETTMAEDFLVTPKPPPELNIPPSPNTVKVSCVDR